MAGREGGHAASAPARAPASHRATTCQAIASAWNTPRPPACCTTASARCTNARSWSPATWDQIPFNSDHSNSTDPSAPPPGPLVNGGDGCRPVMGSATGIRGRPFDHSSAKAVTAITLPTAVGMTASIVSAVARSPVEIDATSERRPARSRAARSTTPARSAAAAGRFGVASASPDRAAASAGRPLMSSVIASIDSSDARCAGDGGTGRFIAAARSGLARAGSWAPNSSTVNAASSISAPSSPSSATSWRRARADRAEVRSAASTWASTRSASSRAPPWRCRLTSLSRRARSGSEIRATVLAAPSRWAGAGRSASRCHLARRTSSAGSSGSVAVSSRRRAVARRRSGVSCSRCARRQPGRPASGPAVVRSLPRPRRRRGVRGGPARRCRRGSRWW